MIVKSPSQAGAKLAHEGLFLVCKIGYGIVF